MGSDPLDAEIQAALDFVLQGGRPGAGESRHLDFKEEEGRRTRDGAVVPGATQSESAAKQFAAEAACMANTAGGGALIVGFADDGQLIGTALNSEWLRRRIFELTDRQVTADVRETFHGSVRILVLRIVEALTPVAYAGRLTWRVEDKCMPVDMASWWAGRLHRLGHDWSNDASHHAIQDARPAAIDLARLYLRDSGEDRAIALAAVPSPELLRRINVVNDDDRLTNAGALLFVGRAQPSIDYLRRDAPGGDSRLRVHRGGRGLLEELREVESAVAASNPAVHVGRGWVQGQIEQLPTLAVREAIVNGVTHRDWGSDAPTVVEHIGGRLVVTSPGGFVGSVRPDNIITHPSSPRYKALAEALASLRVAEREGIGVDRMVGAMIRVGYHAPQIEEVPGPRVRAALVGGRVDESWLRFLGEVQPHTVREDLDVLLLTRWLADHAWVDVRRAAAITQRTIAEAEDALARLGEARFAADFPMVTRVQGTPTGLPAAWRLSDRVRAELASHLVGVLGIPGRAALALDWAEHRGRISTTELADVIGVAVNAVGSTLRGLEDEGSLVPSRQNRAGAGFHYLPAPRAGEL